MLPGTDRVFHRLGANRMTIGHALQAFLPGSSMPYYGDEIAMNNAARVGLLLRHVLTVLSLI